MNEKRLEWNNFFALFINSFYPFIQTFYCNLQIHKQKVKESRWNNGYKNLLWRVDVEAISKDSAESGEPIALFEFVTSKQTGKSETQDTAKFSMNRKQVNDMLMSLESIQKKLDESSY